MRMETKETVSRLTSANKCVSVCVCDAREGERCKKEATERRARETLERDAREGPPEEGKGERENKRAKR